MTRTAPQMVPEAPDGFHTPSAANSDEKATKRRNENERTLVDPRIGDRGTENLVAEAAGEPDEEHADGNHEQT